MKSGIRTRHRASVTAALAFAFACLTAPLPAFAEAVVGEPAPAFSATDSNGKAVQLGDYRGKTVVLEWTNDGCPYVGKHYGTGNMQALQKNAKEKGIVWLTVISSAPGKQGHVSAQEANKLTESRDAAPAAVILDEEGKIGHAFGAAVTPHMYVIDAEGVLQYMGAIDDKPTANHADIETATNYVTAALDAVAEGKTPDPRATRAYGCSVKYTN
jgi:peroxiredoxin